MHSIEDLADWKRCFKLGGMGHSNPSKIKRKKEKEKELMKRQMLVHKFMNDDHIKNLVKVRSEISDQIHELNRALTKTTYDIEEYLEEKGGDEYIRYVDSGYNSRSSYDDSKIFYEEWKLFYNIH